MHELGIAASALQQVLEHAQRAGGSHVVRIALRVGRLSGVDPEALRFALDTLLPGTAAEGASIDIEVVNAIAHCPTCARDFPFGPDSGFACPHCGVPSGEVKQGRELELSCLEVDDQR